MSSGPQRREEVGLDLGATLAKAAVVSDGAPLGDFAGSLFDSRDFPGIASFLRGRKPAAVAVTGAGALRLATRLGSEWKCFVAPEFEAWAAGEAALLSRADFIPTAPHLLVSLGTGTSILRIGPDGITRAGGAGLGGGTLKGFGELLLGEGDHTALVALAARGDRRRVDLLVGDIYGPDEIALCGDLTASNLGRVRSRDPRDVAHAIMGLVGENIGLIAGALASREDQRPVDVVYAGATLKGNEPLKEILAFATSLAGARPRFLPDGEFAGAIGALHVARSRQASAP